MEDEVYHLGLVGTIDPEREPDLARRVLEARSSLMRRLADSDLGRLVESFHPDRYNNNASLAENLLFGTPVGPTFDPERLPENPYMAEVIREAASPREPMLIRGAISDPAGVVLTEIDFEYLLLPQERFLQAAGLPAMPDSFRRHFGEL